MKTTRSSTCWLGALAIAAPLSIAAAGGAAAQGWESFLTNPQTLQSFMANRGIPGQFWAGDEPHAIVSISSARVYEVCNLVHSGHSGERPSMNVDADGTLTVLAQGRCSHVEGATITVVSTVGDTPALGSFRAIDAN